MAMNRKTFSFRIPFSKSMAHIAFERGGADHLRGLCFGSNVRADLYHRGKWQGFQDLGSGLVTNVGVMALANEAITLASPSGARINTLFLANQHFSGKGTTSAAALDYKIETASTVGGQTAVAGTQSFSASGTEAVTEWGLLTSSTASSTTGSPFTAATATTFTGTATPYTASSSTVQGLQQQLCFPGSTTVVGLIASNTTSVATLTNNGTTGWFTVAAMTAGSTPGGTETYVLRPILWDRKAFSAINVVNGDSIQFSYSLTCSSGG